MASIEYLLSFVWASETLESVAQLQVEAAVDDAGVARGDAGGQMHGAVDVVVEGRLEHEAQVDARQTRFRPPFQHLPRRP